MLSWLRRWLRLDSPAREPERPDESGPIETLRDQIRLDVVNGFLDEDAILQNAADVFEEELDPALVKREAPRMLREALAEQAVAERSWSSQTDCDRLDAAFAALEADGVISRQNFTCCGTCGSAEIWDEIAEAEQSGRPARGYAFFHMQDTESAAEGYGLYLNYGAREEGEPAALAIGRDIVEQLTAQGLRTDWDGSLSKRIGVSLDWKKRRVGRWPKELL
ncbi:MAG: hypothetical protein JWP35_1864 [Caulobacter sp.]|nr:hypothetical protein [Caulobacter sp.]